MLDFEAALARAEAEVGVIPGTAAEAIAPSGEPATTSPRSAAADAAGNPAIPLVS